MADTIISGLRDEDMVTLTASPTTMAADPDAADGTDGTDAADQADGADSDGTDGADVDGTDS